MKNKIFICLFLVLLSLPCMEQVFGIFNAAGKNQEFRTLAKFPIYQNNLDEYIDDFDNYYQDNFGFRNTLYKSYSKLKYYGLKASPLPKKLIVGKEGWFFENNRHLEKTLLGRNLISPPKLEEIKENLESKKAWLDEQGIDFYIAVAPMKHRVYKEFLPSYLKNQPELNQFTHLRDFLKSESSVELIDLKSKFDENIFEAPLFYKTDIHWNHFGGYLGALQLLEKIKIKNPKLEISEITEFNLIPFVLKNGSQNRYLNFSIEENVKRIKSQTKCYVEKKRIWPVPDNYKRNPNFYEMRYKCGKPSAKLKVLVIRDSFFMNMMPLFNSCFKEVIYFRPSGKKTWWDEKIILKEKPDILIIETSEMHISTNFL